MSFSGEVKEELYTVIDRGRGAQLAELAAIVCLSAKLHKNNEKEALFFTSDVENLRRKYFTLLKKTININKCDGSLDIEEAAALFEATKLVPGQADGSFYVDGRILQQDSQKRAFLRGAYLCAGVTTDPAKSYHFEIAAPDMAFAEKLTDQIAFFQVDAGVTKRKGRPVVYVKEGAQIAELLGQMGAHRSLIAFENARIVNDMRGNINRRVNCETANIAKTVNSAVRQMECIRKIEETIGLSALPDSLREMAEIRLLYPDEPLADLGSHFDPPIGKSGVNHRLRRIVDLAEKLE